MQTKTIIEGVSLAVGCITTIAMLPDFILHGTAPGQRERCYPVSSGFVFNTPLTFVLGSR